MGIAQDDHMACGMACQPLTGGRDLLVVTLGGRGQCRGLSRVDQRAARAGRGVEHGLGRAERSQQPSGGVTPDAGRAQQTQPGVEVVRGGQRSTPLAVRVG